MKLKLAAFALLSFVTVFSIDAAPPRALPNGSLPNDTRLKPLKDLHGYFPFVVPKSKEEWNARAEYVRRQILVAEGLVPMPTKTPLNAVLHGKIDQGDYTVEKGYFESAPGLFVTGNLYRSKQTAEKKSPVVLFAHGHWQNARLSEESEAVLLKEIATGQERFIKGGRSRFQSMCVQLARMGCIVWQYDMMSDSDAIQLPREVIHTFGQQRREMNTTQNWGLYSPQAEAHLQSVMGLQTLNSIRSLDFVLGLPGVDPDRVAITGASGGGTQTMLLAAVDPRVTLSFPAVMVSTEMQGGCTCENCSLLRVNTGNIEFAALFAPKPQGMTTADDWTREMSTKGFPELQQLYALLGAPSNVMLNRGEHFPHNYNAVSRSAFYTWLNRHFKLGFTEPVIERDYEPLSREQLSVWDAQHPAPKAGDPEFERQLLAWWTKDAESQLTAAASSVESLRKAMGGAVEVLAGRTYATAGETEWDLKHKNDAGSYVEMTGLLRNKTYGEELPVTWLYPKKWNGKAVVWLDNAGKSSLYAADGGVKPAVMKLVNSGAVVVGADLLDQGEFLADGKSPEITRKVKNDRQFAGYTFGYNHALFAQRAHDVLTVVKFLKTAEIPEHPKPQSVDIVAFGGIGPVAALARAVSGDAISRAAIGTHGFRFGKLQNYRSPQFLPGGAKYLDVPGLLALGAPLPLWVAGEGADPKLVGSIYRAAKAESQLSTFTGDASDLEGDAAGWLLK